MTARIPNRSEQAQLARIATLAPQVWTLPWDATVATRRKESP
jgi:hypothetical protein